MLLDYYYFNITNGEHFENELKEFYQKNDFIQAENYIFPDVDTRKDVFGDILGWIIPIIIMLLIWLYIMKRMSASNSPGAGIFSIGKSKAELFDKDTKQKTNFKDVAGLEGAKEEVKEVVDFLKNPQFRIVLLLEHLLNRLHIFYLSNLSFHY